MNLRDGHESFTPEFLNWLHITEQQAGLARRLIARFAHDADDALLLCQALGIST